MASLRRMERADAVLLGCWMTLLWRVSGQSPVRVGVTCHGRSFEELQAVMGPVARTVPVSGALHEGLHFCGLAVSLAEKLDEAEDWQEYYERSSDEGPCEAACFEWDEWPAESPSAGVHFSLVSQHSNSDRCHVRLSLARSGESLTGRLDYDPQVLPTEYVELLALQLCTLLVAAVDDPDATVEQLPLLDEDERRFVVKECNDTRSAYPRDECVHQLFTAQAARTPDRIAVSFGDKA